MNVKFVLIAFLVFMFGLTSCTSEGVATTTANDVWLVDGNGNFSTFSLGKAEEQIPFKIKLPTYIPNNILNSPKFNGPLLNTSHGDNIRLNITYGGSGNQESLISIFESNYPVDTSSSFPGETMAHIKGVNIFYSANTNGADFYWNQDDMGFSIHTFAITLDQSLKLVTSMIS